MMTAGMAPEITLQDDAIRCFIGYFLATSCSI